METEIFDFSSILIILSYIVTIVLLLKLSKKFKVSENKLINIAEENEKLREENEKLREEIELLKIKISSHRPSQIVDQQRMLYKPHVYEKVSSQTPYEKNISKIVMDYNKSLSDKSLRENFTAHYKTKRIGIINSDARRKNTAIEPEFGFDQTGNYIALEYEKVFLVFPYFALIIDEVVRRDITELFDIQEYFSETKIRKFEVIEPAELISQINLLKLKKKGKLKL